MPGLPFWWGQPVEFETGRALRIATQGLLDLPDPFLLGVATQGFMYDESTPPSSSSGSSGQIVSNPTLPPMWSPEPAPAPQFSVMRVAMLAFGSGAVR